MKKSVLATVLAVSLLFTACATKDQKTTSENETSEAVSETTEKPSESETDTTEDPTDPSVNEIVSYDAPSFSEVDYLSYQIETEEVFDFLSKDIKGIEEEDWFSGYNCIEYYIGSCGIPVFEGDAYEKLNAAVKEDFEKIIPNGKEYLESRKDEFSAKFAKEYYSINSEDSLLPAVLRADEKITTIFYPFQVDGEKVVEVTSENLINYDTATGKRIALSDVVKDKDRFTELAKEAILNSTTYDFSGPYQEEEVLSFLNSDNIPFTIDYSGIGVYFQQTVSVSDLSGTGRIEYIGNEDVFNGEYFDVLPEDSDIPPHRRRRECASRSFTPSRLSFPVRRYQFITLGCRQAVRQRILIPSCRWFESSHPSQRICRVWDVFRSILYPANPLI